MLFVVRWVSLLGMCSLLFVVRCACALCVDCWLCLLVLVSLDGLCGLLVVVVRWLLSWCWS